MLFSLLVSSPFSFFQRIVIIILCVFPIAVVCDNGCLFSGEVYPVGKIWHPRITTGGAPVCVTCKCSPGGKFNCATKTCLPGTCLNPLNDPDSCCASCKEVPPDPISVEITSPPYVPLSCLHNGRIFRDGQSFTTNDSGLIPSSKNQCVQCMCQNGAISCELKTCAVLNCPIKTMISSSCCPVCDGQPINCYSGQQSYQHGALWYVPDVPTQAVGCEECKCQYGKAECAPLRCPQRNKLCSSIPKHCCPKCNKKLRSTKPPITEKESVAGGEMRMCLPAKTNIAVYKSESFPNSSGYLKYLFIHSEPRLRTELHSWTLKDGKINEFTVQELSKENTQNLRKAFTFTLNGAIHQKILQKFLQKEKQLKKKCLRKCRKKLERLGKVLKLKNITNRTRCLKGEKVMR